jgi:hypothetical protein
MKKLLTTLLVLVSSFSLATAAAALRAAWDEAYGGANPDRLYAVQPTADGGYIAAGYTSSHGAGGSDAWLVKIDANGGPEWEQTYGSSGYESAFGVAQTLDSNGDPDGYMVFGATSTGVYLVRTDLSGSPIWEKRYFFSSRFYGLNFFFAIKPVIGVQASDGGYVVVANGVNQFGPDGIYVSRLDAAGNFVGSLGWDLVDAEGDVIAHSIRTTSDGGYVLAGEKNFYRLGCETFPDAWLLKLDASTGIEWSQTFGDGAVCIGSGFGSSDEVRDVRQTIGANGSADGYVLAGVTEGSSGDAWLIRTDLSGSQLWDRTYPGFGANAVAQASDGGYAVAIIGALSGGQRLTLTKTDGVGGVERSQTFGDPTGAYDERAWSLETTPDDGYIAAGERNHADGRLDGWMIKIVANAPPVANAGVDQTVQAIYANGSALVTLDGSGSSDPDWDPLTFEWSENGQPLEPLEPGDTVTPTVVLGRGAHAIDLVVSDGQESDQDSVVVNVVATSAGVKGLIEDALASGEIDPDTANELGAHLDNASEDESNGDFDQAIKDLDRFKKRLDKAHDRPDEPISDELFAILRGAADATIAELQGRE